MAYRWRMPRRIWQRWQGVAQRHIQVGRAVYRLRQPADLGPQRTQAAVVIARPLVMQGPPLLGLLTELGGSY